MSWTVVVGAFAIAIVTGLGREAQEDWSAAEEVSVFDGERLSKQIAGKQQPRQLRKTF